MLVAGAASNWVAPAIVRVNAADDPFAARIKHQPPCVDPGGNVKLNDAAAGWEWVPEMNPGVGTGVGTGGTP